MDITSLKPIIEQLPFVGVLIWLVLVLQDKITLWQKEVIDRFTTSMDKRDAAYISVLDKLNANFSNHDAEMRSAMAVMYDRAEREKEGK